MARPPSARWSRPMWRAPADAKPTSGPLKYVRPRKHGPPRPQSCASPITARPDRSLKLARSLARTLGVPLCMGTTTTVRTLVLVEGDSDAGAVRALADRLGYDLDSHRTQVCSADGVTNFSRLLAEFVRAHPDATFCGMYDVAGQWHVRRALAHATIRIAADEPLESFGFFACVADLEDELIRALGPDAVERVIDAQGELPSFRR